MKTAFIIVMSTPVGIIMAGALTLLIGVCMSYEGWYGLRLLINPLAW